MNSFRAMFVSVCISDWLCTRDISTDDNPGDLVFMHICANSKTSVKYTPDFKPSCR